MDIRNFVEIEGNPILSLDTPWSGTLKKKQFPIQPETRMDTQHKNKQTNFHIHNNGID